MKNEDTLDWSSEPKKRQDSGIKEEIRSYYICTIVLIIHKLKLNNNVLILELLYNAPLPLEGAEVEYLRFFVVRKRYCKKSFGFCLLKWVRKEDLIFIHIVKERHIYI